jgi:PAS domain S-box-containing protein
VSNPTSLTPPALPANYQSTVLIIDDTPANLGVTVECLETQGLRVLIAQDGEEGLRRAELVQPDIILLDVMMPHMDGFEVCRRLKKIPAVRDTPVIFMTALSESREKILGFEVGGVDYVTKPIEINELRARVTTHLRLHAMKMQLTARNAQLNAEIARRNAATEALEEQRAFLQTIIDVNPQCLFTKDRDDRFTMVNRSLAKLTHATVAELIGRHSTELRADPGAAARVLDADLEVFATQQDKVIPEETYTDPSGEVHILHTVLRPLIGKDGHASQLLGVTTDITARKQTERELERYREGLEKQVATRTAELNQRNRQLQTEIADRERLQRALLAATDDEQRHLAQELHDGLGQDLVGLSLLMHGAMAEVTAGVVPSLAEMERMTLVVRHALKACHDIAYGLSPLTGASGGLVDALRNLKCRLGGPPGPTLELKLDPDCINGLGSESSDHLYRIAQEAAANAIKHADATCVTISLLADEQGLRLEVSDDGRGIPSERTGRVGLGLHTMHDRAASIGGTVRLEANPTGGTTMVCQVPLFRERALRKRKR